MKYRFNYYFETICGKLKKQITIEAENKKEASKEFLRVSFFNENIDEIISIKKVKDE